MVRIVITDAKGVAIRGVEYEEGDTLEVRPNLADKLAKRGVATIVKSKAPTIREDSIEDVLPSE